MTQEPSTGGASEIAPRDTVSEVVGRVPRVEFLDRAGYRQRRFRDAAKLLPVVAAVFMILPLMWPKEEPDQSLTSSGMIYLFGLWFILILLALGLAWVLRFSSGDAVNEDAKKGLGE